MKLEEIKPTILEKVNAAMVEMGSKGNLSSAPEFEPEYETLRRKKLIFIGASTQTKRSEEFIKAGAKGNINKLIHPISTAVKEIAKLVS